MRKVKFYLTKVPGLMQAKIEDAKEIGKERTGMFHTWGTEIIDDENKISRTVGIIEEDVTGKIFSVNPNNITFIEKE
jgi:hypothetical protein